MQLWLPPLGFKTLGVVCVALARRARRRRTRRFDHAGVGRSSVLAQHWGRIMHMLNGDAVARSSKQWQCGGGGGGKWTDELQRWLDRQSLRARWCRST
eukprot:11782055-Alexandrium_andersonii.AAC.1